MGETYLREQEPVGASGPSRLEDRVMKTVARFLGEDLLPYAGVKGRIARMALTEHVYLEMRRLEEGFSFVMKNSSVNMRFTQG